jgi:hypothetical protein
VEANIIVAKGFIKLKRSPNPETRTGLHKQARFQWWKGKK